MTDEVRPEPSGQNGNLKIRHVALVTLSLTCGGIDDRLIVGRQDALLPTHLGIVDLGHDGTDTIEIFLGRIAQGETAGEALMHILRHLGHEAHITEHHAAIETDREITTMLAHLGYCHGDTHEWQEKG